MAKMAELHAELTELPDEVKEQLQALDEASNSDFMQGFYRGRAEGLAIGQDEGAFAERERIITILNNTVNVYLKEKLLIEAAIISNVILFIKE